jgi:lipoyl(octanoyl) transferase
VTARRELWIAHLGLRPYGEVLEVQRAAAAARITGEIPQDVLILVEHPPVVTLGRGSHEPTHLVASPTLLESRGVELYDVERGGDVTFHGPGQLVAYPIFDLTRHKQDLHWYLRQVEETIIRSLAPFGIAAERRSGLTGVWTGGRKIASIGVHARAWVTWHGFALNVTTDLSYFDLIIPCGILGVTMTSVEQELLRRTDAPCLAPSPALAEEVEDAVIASACEVFGLQPVRVDPAALVLHAAGVR